VYKSPNLALGPDGVAYIATASQILRLQPDSTLQAVAGKPVLASDITYPQDPLAGLPLPALGLDLPSPNAIIVDDSGTIFFATHDSVYSIQGGLLQLVGIVGTTIALPPGAINGPNITGLAIDGGGRLLISDSANQMVYSAGSGAAEVIATNTRFISDGSVLSRTDSAPLLRVDSEQQAVCTS